MKFSTVWESDYLMNSNGFFCGINMPDALQSKESKDSEYKHRLPPYARRKTFLVDEYLACPSNWLRSSGKLTSYFVPIQEGKGLWLDFNKNQEKNYHVAIVISVQGVNPITGMPCQDAQLEQYIDTCPKHNIKFGPNRYCEKCGYKWPKQNYISTTGNNVGELWLDGFRTAEGVVRQYILTKEDTKRTKRGVASNIIGEDRVYAIGLSFFLSKEQRKIKPDLNVRSPIVTTYPIVLPLLGGNSNTGTDYNKLQNINDYDDSHLNLNTISSSDPKHCSYTISNQYLKGTSYSPITYDCVSKPVTASAASCVPSETNCDDSLDDYRGLKGIVEPVSKSAKSINSIKMSRTVKVDKLEVSAGANIEQSIGDDPEPLDFWRKEPEAIICVNYCNEDDCEQIIKAGKIKLNEHKEGFLKEVPVGN